MANSDSYMGDITRHRMAPLIFEAWNSDSPQARRRLAEHPPPGAIALRCRYRHLLDTAVTGAAVEPVDPEEWHRALTAETEGDTAIREGGYDRAHTVFADLAAATTSGVTRVNAWLGVGDAHRHLDTPEQAVAAYQRALGDAVALGYRFGELRALVALGHLTRMHHSAGRATERFTRALTLAEELADPVYEGNALLGLGECEDRLGSPERAAKTYERAHRVFAAVHGVTGQAHSAQRLGAVLLRLRRPDEATTWLVRAAQLFDADDDPVGVTNVLGDLGDFLLRGNDPDSAEVQYRAALTIATERGLPRARAHALHDLARVARSRADWHAAVTGFEQSLAAYRELDDLLGVCTALGKLAEAREALGEAGRALRDRVAAVFAIEEFRATHRESAAQQEYRGRFAGVYSAALRAAVAVGDAASFAVVAEALAGRRLAGLAQAPPDAASVTDAEFAQEMIVHADQRWAAGRRGPVPGTLLPPGTDRRRRILRMMGALAIPQGLREPAEEALEDVLASVYLPPAEDGADLIRDLPPGCHALQPVVDPDAPDHVHWLWHNAEGRPVLGSARLSEPCRRLLAVLQEDSAERSALVPGQLAPLAELVPDRLRDQLAEPGDHRLLLLPVGELWLVPWGAVPLRDGLLLGQAARFAVCPSLFLQRALRRRGPAGPADAPAVFWRSPYITHHEPLPVAGRELERPADAGAVKQRLGAGCHTVIVVCHGRLVQGTGHYLELDGENWLLPADVLRGLPPRRLYLVTCWGAGIPGRAMTDPVSIATLALARGTVELLATVGEFNDTPVAEAFVRQVLDALHGAHGTVADAVHHAISAAFAFPAMWDCPVREWGALLPIGTFLDPTAPDIQEATR
ncbi:tetratricopeptide repeat protein [Streptomyces herbicida]|uniref:tetratricopeptide repeat protein n=1 Tax=Streptomyces herbicida TaxID=3065675 RepID=UPI00292EAC0F|nr:tetratricopeptide repeat protein [Streptomyces sp. NEAU-HV9]